MSLIEFSGLALGFLSLVLTWFLGTRKRRLTNKIKKQEKKLSKLETYSSNTGYKTILHDCFHTISYVGGMLLLFSGIKIFLGQFGITPEKYNIIESFTAGIFIGSSFVLLELFVLLSKANKSSGSIKSLKEKIEKLRESENEI